MGLADYRPTSEKEKDQRSSSSLSSLVPLCHQTNQRTDGTSQTDHTVIDVDVSKGRDGNEQIAKVGNQLCLGGASLAVKVLGIVLVWNWA